MLEYAIGGLMSIVQQHQIYITLTKIFIKFKNIIRDNIVIIKIIKELTFFCNFLEKNDLNLK